MFKHGSNNKGVSVVEYALLAALIGTASVLAVTTFGTQTASLFEREDLRLADSHGGGDNSAGGSTGSGDGLGDHRATQNLDMSLFRIVNVNDPLNPSDVATKGYVDTTVASISANGDDLGSHTATQNLDLALNRIINLATPQDGSDAANKNYVDEAISGAPGDNLGDHTATQNISLSGNWLSGNGSDSGVFVSGNGDVGIGTSSPVARLDIRGGVSILNAGSSNSTIAYANDSKAYFAGLRGDTNNVWALSDETNFRLVVDPNGNVGIGTATPQATLDVAGGIRGGNTSRVWHTINTGTVSGQPGWFTVPGLSLTINLDRPASVEIAVDGNLRAAQTQCQLGTRFRVNGAGQGHDFWGSKIVRATAYDSVDMHHSTLNHFRVFELPAGSHTIEYQVNISNTGGYACVACGEFDGTVRAYTVCTLKAQATFAE